MISILGIGWVGPPGLAQGKPDDVDTPCDPTPHLRDRKSLKLMARQDMLALVAAARAVEDARVDLASERTGVYFAVGGLAFEAAPLDLLAERSAREERFDMARFCEDAYPALHPLFTFKCLPNMPVFHISYNLGIRGPYMVTHPGPGQWFEALQAACDDLEDGVVDHALVGAVADQRNPLGRHHAARCGSAAVPVDASCVLVVGRGEGRARIEALEIEGGPVDLFAPCPASPVGPSLAIAADCSPRTLEWADDGIRARLTLG